MSDVPSPWMVDRAVLENLRLETARNALDKDPHMALVEAEELLDNNPHHIEALRISGMAAAAVGDVWMAREALLQVLQQKPDDREALHTTMAVLFECLEFDAATALATTLLEQDPATAEAHYMLGLCLERTGHPRKAKQAFRQAAEINAASFPLDEKIADKQWSEAAESARALLPGPMRAFYKTIEIEWEQLPTLEELKATEPNLSPFAEALLVGEPDPDVDPWTHPPERVRLFRANLARPAPQDVVELAERIASAMFREAAEWLGPEVDQS